MNQTITRRSLARYAASQLNAGIPADQVMNQLAAYLVESGRVREADLVVRTIEDEFAAEGIIIARVITAEPLSDKLREFVAARLNGQTVHIDEKIDPAVLGGIRIETADSLFDGTVKRKLLTLRHAKL